MAARGLPDLDVAQRNAGAPCEVPEYLRSKLYVECDIAPRYLTILECRALTGAPWSRSGRGCLSPGLALRQDHRSMDAPLVTGAPEVPPGGAGLAEQPVAGGEVAARRIRSLECLEADRGPVRACESLAARHALPERADRRQRRLCDAARPILQVGQPANWIAADIVRLENGLLAEHWDVIQDEATREDPKADCPCSARPSPGLTR